MLRHTKIVATLGPASSDLATLERLVQSGVDVVRLNFSHGTAEDHIKRANQIRDAAQAWFMRQARAHSDGAAMAYARFFLHAITDNEELAFFKDMSAALHEGDRLAVEYRTVRDEAGQKVTAAHYRRFVEPAQVIANAAKFGFTVEYEVEGYGFAKYLNDDAYVARSVFRKAAA